MDDMYHLPSEATSDKLHIGLKYAKQKFSKANLSKLKAAG
jgi:hypothetical protein